jgi:hypothetical protein
MRSAQLGMMRGLDKFDSCTQFRRHDPHLCATVETTSIHIALCASFQGVVHVQLPSNSAQLLETLPFKLNHSIILLKGVEEHNLNAACSLRWTVRDQWPTQHNTLTWLLPFLKCFADAAVSSVNNDQCD